MDGGRPTEACAKLEESQRLDAAMGTRFRLSQCYEAIGRTASAWAGYIEVADLARAAGQDEREKAARARAAQLEPKLARVVIAVTTPGLDGLEIRRRDIVIGKAQWGTSIPVDPGRLQIVATAPGKTAWTQEIAVAASASLTITVPTLADALSGGALAGPVEEPRSRAGSGQRTGGIVALGAGLLGMGVGAALAVVAKSDYDDSAGEHCRGSLCDAQGKDATDAARRLGTAATVVFGVGAAVAVTGVVVWLTAPRSSTTKSASVSVRVAPQAILLGGEF